MFFRKRRRSGMGLGGLLVIGAILYFTPAGPWLWERIEGLPESCYALFMEMGMGGEGVCRALGSGIEAMGDLGDRLHGQSVQVVRSNQTMMQLDALSNQLLGNLDRWGSSGSSLDAMLRDGPRIVTGNATQRLQGAIDQYVIGNHMLNHSQPGKALPWFEQSARQGDGFGVLSQLKLGDMYRGGQGVAPNPQLASQYYSQAQRSLSMLQRSDSPQSQQLLQSLPGGSTGALQAQLQQIVQAMKNPR